MFMFQRNKQKKKDKLWFACNTLFQEYNQGNDVMPSVQPQQRLPLHQLRPQLQNQQMLQLQISIMDHQDLPPPQYVPMKCCGKCACSSMSSILENSQQQLLHPVNILQCVCSNRCCERITDDVSHPMEMESGSEEMSIEQDYENRTDGFYCESCGDNSTDCNEGDDYDHQYSNLTAEQTEKLIAQQLKSWQQTHMPSFHQMSTTTTTNNSSKSNAMAVGNVLNYCCTNGESVSNESSVGKSPQLLNQNQNYSLNNNNNSIPTPVHSTVTSSITATAASVFRNCCRGSQSNESSIGSCPYPPNNRNYTLNNNNNNAMAINHHNNNNSKSNFNFYEQKPNTTNDYSVKELFEALMKKLKVTQMDTLCQVVENRCGTDANNSGGWRRQTPHRPTTQQSSDCVLVPRETIGGEEPNVIACRLWSWPDLKTSTELKRIPMCPNGKERVYVCCNPAHWNRILIEEAIPPPYQESVMDRLKPEDRAPSENSKDGCVSTFSGTTTGLRVQIPESFTTNGEDHSSPSPTWCQIDYWELAQRVGERYEAKNSTVNVYSEGSGGMDLKVLAQKKGVTVPSVHKTRQKIGLGITLSQEADGVWLYNRSKAPIFIHSPTLNDDCRHVCKVPPGYCLNAFDKNRARTQKLVGSPQTGPIDTFSMKISFAKGWGSKYHRSDITACHCWLEVLFSRR